MYDVFRDRYKKIDKRKLKNWEHSITEFSKHFTQLIECVVKSQWYSSFTVENRSVPNIGNLWKDSLSFLYLTPIVFPFFHKQGILGYSFGFPSPSILFLTNEHFNKTFWWKEMFSQNDSRLAASLVFVSIHRYKPHLNLKIS